MSAADEVLAAVGRCPHGFKGHCSACAEKPAPTVSCIDYGHHGRERCVFCGLPRPAELPVAGR